MYLTRCECVEGLGSRGLFQGRYGGVLRLCRSIDERVWLILELLGMKRILGILVGAGDEIKGYCF
jgi:hypothetical protein